MVTRELLSTREKTSTRNRVTDKSRRENVVKPRKQCQDAQNGVKRRIVENQVVRKSLSVPSDFLTPFKNKKELDPSFVGTLLTPPHTQIN